MKTKEQILIEQGDSYLSPEVLSAMDEYAKEMCIDFLNDLRDCHQDDILIKEERTSEELFEIYKEYKNEV